METLRRKRIGRSFALAAEEVTVAQFREFRENHFYDQAYARADDGPINDVTWHLAAEYCNWLSEKEEIPPEQWCYEPDPRPGAARRMRLKANYLHLTGYRLPTAAEWEYACRAGTVTSRPCGETDELLDRYAWYDKNSDGVLHPVGQLRPNEWGLFDMLGNALEWCLDVPVSYSAERLGQPGEDQEQAPGILDGVNLRVSRGGAFDHGRGAVRSAYENRGSPTNDTYDTGFRVARTFGDNVTPP
jgi:formylglycine-generating enzyme required for sulfatase activity